MRMWMCDPRMMCRSHLLGEHVECHMFLSAINNRRKIDGYIRNNLLEPKSLSDRHLLIALEMIRRGYKHTSPFTDVDLTYLTQEQREYKIDTAISTITLIRRCWRCEIGYAELVRHG
jgi:Pyrimidine dimer DNA glycosylase